MNSQTSRLDIGRRSLSVSATFALLLEAQKCVHPLLNRFEEFNVTESHC